jgi:hypothetical protein
VNFKFYLATRVREILSMQLHKAKESCKTSKEEILDHFVDVDKMVKI